ncbi:hypothetical protein ACGFYQ_40650 [Streptomyces sp. NPDC048258]|uniref:hypothetical protein n=1 Tax=Streptomyces sp. NPDC048258 TaxID=3365527 RepID=UPI00371D619B
MANLVYKRASTDQQSTDRQNLVLDEAGIEDNPVVFEEQAGTSSDLVRRSCRSAAGLEPAERATLDQGVTVRRGQGYTLRVSAVPAVHRALLDLCQPLDGAQGAPAVPAQRKARREYENRVNALTTATRR